MGAPGMGVELEEGEQRLVSRFGARGLAHMHGATISALHGDGDPVLEDLSVVGSGVGGPFFQLVVVDGCGQGTYSRGSCHAIRAAA